MFAYKYLALAAAAAIGSSAAPLSKRDFSGRATYYAVGLGNCGGTNSGNEMVVALNTAQYGSTSQQSQYCGRQLVISYGGRTQTARVVDSCPTCPYGGLDLSEGLFSALSGGNMGMGVMQVNWHWAGEGGNAQPAAPKTTSTPAYTPPKAAYTPPSTTQQQQAAQTPAAASSSSDSNKSSSNKSSGSSKPSTAASVDFASGSIAKQNVTGVPLWWAEVGTAGCADVVVPANQTAVAIAPSANTKDLAEACGRSVTIVNNDNGLNISAVVTTWIPGGEENSVALSEGYKLLANVTGDANPAQIANVTWGFAPANNKTKTN